MKTKTRTKQLKAQRQAKNQAKQLTPAQIAAQYFALTTFATLVTIIIINL